jgi:rSAM/selenodomain-associated transferase 2
MGFLFYLFLLYSLPMLISIIIPTFNEAAVIVNLIQYLRQHSSSQSIEIIVSDGGSTDNTVQLARDNNVTVIISPQKGRAAQMNYGAALSTAPILYFVHADCFPPASFVADILASVKNGYDCGRYQTRFNTNRWIFKFNAFFTRFDWFICYGGDQTFFVTAQLFSQLNGYKKEMKIMEEYDLTVRAKQAGNYIILKGKALVSIRKYEGRSWWQVQMANRKAVALYRAGASQQLIADTYKKMLEIS